MHYSVRPLTDLVYGKEFFILESNVEVDDDVWGVIDEPKLFPFQEWFMSEYSIFKEPSQDHVSNDTTEML